MCGGSIKQQRRFHPARPYRLQPPFPEISDVVEAKCGSPEIVEGFLCRFRLGLGLPDLVVDGREPVGGTVPALVIVEGVAPVDNRSLHMNTIT